MVGPVNISDRSSAKVIEKYLLSCCMIDVSYIDKILKETRGANPFGDEQANAIFKAMLEFKDVRDSHLSDCPPYRVGSYQRLGPAL